MGPRDIARATGVSTDTLRHYERKGLLPGVTRTASGYRRFSAASVQRVLLIQRALVVGFSLSDLQRVFAQRDRGGAPCRSVRELVGTRLDELSRHIEDLVGLRNDLRSLLDEWDATLARTPSGERAHLLESLGSKSGIDRNRRTRRAPLRRPKPRAL
jgi:DNA-binding transcriptional MerR regulator